MPKQKLPSNSEIATLLGLEGLHSGMHIIRKYPIHGEPVGRLRLNYCWQVIITPQNGDHLVLCGAVAEPDEGFSIPPNPLEGWKKFVLASGEECVVCPFKHDPVANELFNVNIMPSTSRGVVLCSGVSYQINVSTPEMQAHIDFKNPADQNTLKLVGSLLGVAKWITQQIKTVSLHDSVLSWEKSM